MKYPLVAILIMTSCTLFAQGSNVNMMAVTNGIGIGAAIAVVASWSRNKSVLDLCRILCDNKIIR